MFFNCLTSATAAMFARLAEVKNSVHRSYGACLRITAVTDLNCAGQS